MLDGINFCVFSRHATRVELLLYGKAESAEPFQVIELSPEENRSFFFWHVFVVGLRPRTYYTWRAAGPNDAQRTGRCFNPRKELVDPWAGGVSDATWDRRRASDAHDAGHACIRAIVTEPLPPRSDTAAPRGLDGAVIYELHVGGFTRHPSSAVEHPGTFAGLREKVPYLRSLGVTLCAVCKEKVAKVTNSIVDVIHQFSPTSTNLTITNSLPQTFTIAHFVPPGNNPLIGWKVDGVTVPNATGTCVKRR